MMWCFTEKEHVWVEIVLGDFPAPPPLFTHYCGRCGLKRKVT